MIQHREPGSQPVNRPFWNRHPRAILGVTAAVLFVGVALAPSGPGAFAIEPGQGIIRKNIIRNGVEHDGINFEQSVNIAQRCGIALYMGKIQTDEYRISYEVARKLESETDQTQVTAGVRAGERFNYRRNFFGIGAWVGDTCPAGRSDERLYD